MDPLKQRVLKVIGKKPEPMSGTIYRAHLQRVQEMTVSFTLEPGEIPQKVAWELADGGWATVDRDILSLIEVHDEREA